MKKILLSALIACCSFILSAQVNVTFRVNMQDQTVSPNGVHIAGDFQGWNPSSSLLTDVDSDGIYEITLPVTTNSTAHFKFINGNSWGAGLQESVPSACGADDGNGGNNRTFVVATSDASYGPVCFSSCEDCEEEVEPTFVDVTFQVNMNDQIVSANGVHIAGSFQGWNPSSSQLTDTNSDGIYEITLPVETNTTAEFKFINGNSWGAGEEAVPSTCGTSNGNGGYNRTFVVGETATSFAPVCFGSCEDCEEEVEPTFVDVTFRVNMAEQTVSENGIHVAGTFQDWNTSSTELTDENADGIYEVTVSIESGSSIQYKFLNGNDWGQDETVPAECATENNRTYTVGNNSAILPIVCYGACSDCDIVIEPTYVDVTFQVNMENETVSANGLHIAGSMQGWNPATSELTDENSDGIYEITLQVEANSTVQFKFINDNNWGAGEETVPAACGTDNGNGGYNRTFEVGETDVTLGPVCFSSCENCEEVEEPTTVNVTFQVNMQNETISANGVHIAGSMQGWNPATSQLTDSNSDGIYEITLPVDTNSTIQFKFLNGNTWGTGIQEIVPSTCGVDDNNGGYNRSLEVGNSDMTFGPVCFAACENCTTIEPVMVTLRVDMSQQTVSAAGVFVAGSFNGWDPTATQMSEYETGKYLAIVVLSGGQTYQYKYLNGSEWSGAEIVPVECGVDDGNGGNNRSYTASVNETLPVVCFSQCAACVNIQMTQVTFVLNMQNETVSPLGVHVAGTFNGFSSASTPMTLQAGALYTATVSIPANTQVQFKYLNGNDFVGQETVPFECGVNDGFGGYNRNYTVGSTNVTLPQVCFSSCADCTVGVGEHVITDFSIYPNPASDRFYIRLSEKVASELHIYDATGRAMQLNSINSSGLIEINTDNWNNGIYHIVVPNIGQQSIIINK